MGNQKGASGATLKQRLRAAAGPTVHFHSSDDRACADKRLRRFTVDPNDVTCPDCKSRDRFWITEQGRQLVMP